mgnify:CR=1 FL=1
MWYIEPIEIFMIIPKTISLIINIIVLVILSHKQKLMLTWAILLGLFCWTLYVLFDLIIFMIIANSALSFTIANMLFDWIFILSHSFAFFIYLTAELIKIDEQPLNKRKMGILIGILALSATVMILATELVIYDSDRTIIPADNLPPIGFFTVEAKNIAIAIPFAFTVFIIFFASIRTLWILVHSFNDEILKKKVRFLLIGAILIAAGMLWYLIVPTLFPGKGFIPSFGGHVLWVFAPIYFLKSQITPSKPNK